MKNIVIITAKGGNTSIENKNVIPVCGSPIMLYPIRAAKLAQTIDDVFISTEDEVIASIAQTEGVKVISRPQSLARPESQHRDVIKHAVEHLLNEYPTIENVIVLLGNTVMVTPGLIDKAIKSLNTKDCDSVMSAWKAQDDHPFRAMRKNTEGYVEPFEERTTGSNRQEYPDVFFYDQGVWGFKAQCAIKQEGPAPWVWLGKKCKMIERPWVTGRDVHSWIDISASSWYLNSIQAMDYLDYSDDD